MSAWFKQVFDHPDFNGSVIIAAKTVVVYLFLIAGLRLLGKRELGQMNIFDLVLIIVLGNSVQNAMMNNDNSLVGGLIAGTVLLTLNRVFNIVLQRSKRAERLMVGHPMLILSEGNPIEYRMKREGVTRDQLMMALREHGLTRLDQARMCVLEVDGSISVIPVDSEVLRTRHHFKALRMP
jgi:uncharacterized membrane protein YcaP (DUF421 family)